MDYNSAKHQCYQPYNPQYPQHQPQAAGGYDPSQIQAYYQQQQQQYQYYPSQDYTAASYTQQYHQESTSIHPPGVPITPDPTHYQDQHNAYYPQGVVENLSQEQSVPTQYVAQRTVQPRGGQFAYRGRGRRGGRPFRGAGRGRFGQHGHRAKGPPAQTPLTAPAQVPTAAGNPPPPRMAWCELCRVDCNTQEILEQHKSGKRHKKNLQKHEELQNLNKLLTSQQNVQTPSSDIQPTKVLQTEKVEAPCEKQESTHSQALLDDNSNKTELQKKEDKPEASTVNLPGEPQGKSRDGQYKSRGRGSKRKMRGGRGGKYIRTNEGLKRAIEPPKPKEVIPLICELCNVKCETQVVFNSHLAGKKHIANVKRFNGHRALYGEAELQALYPSNFNNASSSTSIIPQVQQQGVSSDPQIVLAQLLTYVLSQAQAQAQAQAQTPGVLAAQAPGLGSSEVPATILPTTSGSNQENQYQHNSQTPESLNVSEAGGKDIVIGEGEHHKQSVTTESSTYIKALVSESKDTNLEPLEEADTLAKSEVVSSGQAIQPGFGNVLSNPESEDDHDPEENEESENEDDPDENEQLENEEQSE